MSGKKFLIILGGLAVLSFGVSLAISMLLGGSEPASPPGPQATTRPALTGADALLATAGAPGRLLRQMLPAQRQVEELIKDLRARVTDYDRRERQLDDREKRLQLTEQNLQRRAKELEKLRMELVTPWTRLKEAAAELERSRVNVDAQEKAAILNIAATFEKMDSAEGAAILEGMCQNEQTDDVVKILFYVSERPRGKLLGEIKDKDLAAKLTALMQKVREVNTKG